MANLKQRVTDKFGKCHINWDKIEKNMNLC